MGRDLLVTGGALTELESHPAAAPVILGLSRQQRTDKVTFHCQVNKNKQVNASEGPSCHLIPKAFLFK